MWLYAYSFPSALNPSEPTNARRLTKATHFRPQVGGICGVFGGSVGSAAGGKVCVFVVKWLQEKAAHEDHIAALFVQPPMKDEGKKRTVQRGESKP